MSQSDEIGQLVAAICAVMRDVPAVGASSRNDHQRYSYTSDAELLCSLQPAMARHGVAIVPMQSAPTVVERSTASGKGGVRIDLVQTYRICHSSGEYMTAQVMGCGTDTQDKAAYKAMTGAFKYVLRQTFAVPTGDDAERTVARRKREQPPAPAVPPASPAQPAPAQPVTDLDMLHALFSEQVGVALAGDAIAKGGGAAARLRELIQGDGMLTHARDSFEERLWAAIMPRDLDENGARKYARRLRTDDGKSGLRRQFYKHLAHVVQEMDEDLANFTSTSPS